MRTSFIATATFASQLSVAVTVGAVGTAEHSTVMFVGTPTKTGAVLSSRARTRVHGPSSAPESLGKASVP